MKLKAFTRRIQVILLILCLAVCSVSEGVTEEEKTTGLKTYLNEPFTMQDLFKAAEDAYSDGMSAEKIRSDMYMLADSVNAADYLECALENIGAYGSEEYNDMLGVLGTENGNRLINQFSLNGYENSKALDYTVYDMPEASQALKEALGIRTGHYCLRPYFWMESDFNSFFGKKFSQFKPDSPRPGYVCVVLRDGAESAPETRWKGENEKVFLDALRGNVTDLEFAMIEDGAPILTGNPHLASAFWVFDMKYPYRGLYGSSGEIRGYNCQVSLTVINATTHKTIAEFSETNVLANTIYSWENGIAKEDPPRLETTDGYFTKLAAKAEMEVRKERSKAASSRKITVLNAEKTVEALLLAQTEKMKDAWQQALYQSGAKDVILEGNTLSFRMRSYNPRLSELGSYAKAADGKEWLSSALKNAGEYDLEITLELEDGLISQKSLNSLRSTVQKAAAAAGRDFGGKDMTAALKAELFPNPIQGKLKDPSDLLKPDESFLTWMENHENITGKMSAGMAASLFYAQKSQTVSVKDGPHAVTMTCVGSGLQELLETSSKDTLDTYAYVPVDERPSGDSMVEALLSRMAENAVSAKKKANTKTVLTLDLDELAMGLVPSEYSALLTAVSQEEWVRDTVSIFEMLPDEAAQAMPKPGILSGSSKGTRVNFKISDDSDPTCIIMRDTGTNEIAVKAFAVAGKTTTVNVPQGFYIIAWTSGPYWYGEEKMFYGMGGRSKSDPVEILGSRYYHTFTLVSSKEGDVNIYPADASDFK